MRIDLLKVGCACGAEMGSYTDKLTHSIVWWHGDEQLVIPITTQRDDATWEVNLKIRRWVDQLHHADSTTAEYANDLVHMLCGEWN